MKIINLMSFSKQFDLDLDLDLDFVGLDLDSRSLDPEDAIVYYGFA